MYIFRFTIFDVPKNNKQKMAFDDLNEIKFQQAVGDTPDVLKYLHNTNNEEVAHKIIEEGFIFEKYIENSTDLVSGLDLIELRYFIQHRGSYGHFTIIIHICRKLADHYFNELKSAKYHFSEVLSKELPEFNSDSEPVYILPEQFVKGYYNRKTNQFFVNPNFNPYFRSPIFERNIEFLLNSDY